MKSALSRCAIFFFVIGGLMTLLALFALVFRIPLFISLVLDGLLLFGLDDVVDALLKLFQGLFLLTFAMFCLQFSRMLSNEN
jgi:hypothetical protein